MVISLWSGPRNCSTALMYSFAQRSDMKVVDEPLFGHFLRKTGVERPSRKEVIRSMPWKRKEVLKQWEGVNQHVFLKHMGNHLEGWSASDFEMHKHLILVRDPRNVLNSYRAHIKRPTTMDLAYNHQWKWLNHCEQSGWPVAVVESDALVANPEASLRTICDWLGLLFDSAMLQWPRGPREEDGIWAKYWYERVHASTGWESPKEERTSVSNPTLPKTLESLLQEVEPIYDQLKRKSII